jgi:hypothetical protein
MMEADRASETLEYSSILTWLVAQEDLSHLVAAKSSSRIKIL